MERRIPVDGLPSPYRAFALTRRVTSEFPFQAERMSVSLQTADGWFIAANETNLLSGQSMHRLTIDTAKLVDIHFAKGADGAMRIIARFLQSQLGGFSDGATLGPLSLSLERQQEYVTICGVGKSRRPSCLDDVSARSDGRVDLVWLTGGPLWGASLVYGDSKYLEAKPYQLRFP
ncbi:MAG: hypothetical protein NVSMB1_11970 [Polyangiales bacterium]